MKKYLIIFLLFSIATFVFVLSENDYFYSGNKIESTEFVTLKDKTFYLRDKPFYPVAINFMTSVQADKDGVWPSSYKGYFAGDNFKYTNRDSCIAELTAEFALIRKMGFNTVRVVGIGEETVEDRGSGLLSIYAYTPAREDSTILLKDNESYERYFKGLETLFEIAQKTDLKVILLLKIFNEVPNNLDHIKKLAKRFQANTNLMAYDLYNEPLYFDSLPRKKKEVYEITKRWSSIVKKCAPNQLCTIGMTGIREVFEWDPNIVNVDFLSMHPYEYEPDQVRNEIYWYHKYINKPWIIGETSLPADNDSVSYEDQSKFAIKTIKQTYNCGGSGYSWWQYKDVDWFNFHANFMGVMNRKGQTIAESGFVIEGSPKPVSQVFTDYKSFSEKGECVCMENYYNYSNHNAFILSGKIIDDNNKPIEGAVILAWNESWQYSFHTVTQKDGSFELRGRFPFYHWMASATLYSMIRGDITPADAKPGTNNIPTFNLGPLKVEHLDFID